MKVRVGLIASTLKYALIDTKKKQIDYNKLYKYFKNNSYSKMIVNKRYWEYFFHKRT